MFLCGKGWNGCVVGCNVVGVGLVDFGVDSSNGWCFWLQLGCAKE